MQLDANLLMSAYADEMATLQRRVVELTALAKSLSAENTQLKEQVEDKEVTVPDSENESRR